jgi:hypothetical protein
MANSEPSRPVTVKNGLTTTEFWQMLMVVISSIAVAGAALVGMNYDSSALNALIPSVATIAAAITTAFYSHSRAAVKSAAHAAEAHRYFSSPPTLAVGADPLAADGSRP